ncbi:tetratricopeptide repeat protein [Macrococcus caseolyticus]|uniref:tetratricopeptide repeat protein n=1 Tax=Macrococcoides caseolyticum TaxID=69966 RepID=UPI0024BD5443|nr:tetratricopeptide repeat protein [Macrococcus caseolyticus]MDJ1153656.1 tetratricopeptide repeat protein [Macrococcus caseolyticus]
MDINQLIDQIHLQHLEGLNDNVKSALFTEDHDALFELGTTLMQFGIVQEGKLVFERLFELYPDEPEVLSFYIESLIDTNDMDQALMTLHGLPKTIERLMLEADIFQQQDMPEVAIEKVKEAYELSSEDPVLSFALAELYYFDGQYLPAVRNYETLLNSGIDEINNVNLNLRIADSLLQTGDYDQAVVYYEKIDEKDYTSDDFFKKAISYQKSGLMDRAISTLQSLLDKDPDFMQAYLLLVELLESERKYEDAILVGQQGIRLNEFYKELLADTGRIMIKMHNEKGADYLIQALTIDPSYTEAGLVLADYYRKEELYEEMVQLFTVIDEDDIDPEILWHLAYSYQQLEKDKEAQHFYKEAYNSLNENVSFLKDYYYYSREIADQMRSEQLYKIIISLDPEFDDIY